MDQQKLLEEIKKILDDNVKHVCYTTFDQGLVTSYKERVWTQIQKLIAPTGLQ